MYVCVILYCYTPVVCVVGRNDSYILLCEKRRLRVPGPHIKHCDININIYIFELHKSFMRKVKLVLFLIFICLFYLSIADTQCYITLVLGVKLSDVTNLYSMLSLSQM